MFVFPLSIVQNFSYNNANINGEVGARKSILRKWDFKMYFMPEVWIKRLQRIWGRSTGKWCNEVALFCLLYILYCITFWTMKSSNNMNRFQYLCYLSLQFFCTYTNDENSSFLLAFNIISQIEWMRTQSQYFGKGAVFFSVIFLFFSLYKFIICSV